MPRVIKNVTKLPESSPIDENRVKTTPILKETETDKSPVMEEVIVEKEDVPVEKKVRQHLSLPAKYSKFIEFGYYLLNKISFDFIQDSNNEAVVFNEVEMLNKLNLLDPIDVQQQLVQEYFDTSKQIHKDLRDIVRKQQREAKKLAAASEKKTRKPRAKKTVDEDPSNEEEKPVKEKKEKPVKQPKEKKEKPVKEPKEKKTKKSKEEATGTEVAIAVPTEQTPADDDDELQVSVFELNGTQYLIDDENTVYDFNTHLKIGTLINNNISLE